MNRSIVNNLCRFVIMTASLSCAAIGGAAPDKPLTREQKKVAVVRLLKSFAGGDPGALDVIDPEHYTQHNLRLEDGLAGLNKRLAAVAPGSTVNVVRVLADGDYVVAHSEFNFGTPLVAVDIFRFHANRIVEHWDNIEQKCASPNASGRTQLDGPTAITDLDQTAANKTLMREYFNVVVIGGQRDQASRFRDSFHQHNCFGEDNKSGAQATLGPFAKPGFVYRVDKEHIVLGEGNFVLVVNEGLFDDKPAMFYDFYRIADHKIVEHWDVIEAIPPQVDWKNPNGNF
jgi:predicted SnoaL-like aldol condensation-catalyzing enzyme